MMWEKRLISCMMAMIVVLTMGSFLVPGLEDGSGGHGDYFAVTGEI